MGCPEAALQTIKVHPAAAGQEGGWYKEVQVSSELRLTSGKPILYTKQEGNSD